MIKSFKSKSLRKLYTSDDRCKINPNHVSRILRVLDRLDASVNPQDMNLPGYGLHQLKGGEKGIWAVKISGNWRIIFKFEGTDATEIDYIDYH
jgi:proteic killer suppression protein